MKRELRRWLDEQGPNGDSDLVEPSMTIGEGARATGLSESALRKYEAAGLVIYHRSSGNVRVLSQDDLQRIRLIQALIKEEGLNLEGIRRLWSLLPCWECKDCSEEERAMCPAMKEENQPCWVLKKRKNPGQAELCRHCDVYRLSAGCTQHLKYLVHSASRPGEWLEAPQAV